MLVEHAAQIKMIAVITDPAFFGKPDKCGPINNNISAFVQSWMGIGHHPLYISEISELHGMMEVKTDGCDVSVEIFKIFEQLVPPGDFMGRIDKFHIRGIHFIDQVQVVGGEFFIAVQKRFHLFTFSSAVSIRKQFIAKCFAYGIFVPQPEAKVDAAEFPRYNGNALRIVETQCGCAGLSIITEGVTVTRFYMFIGRMQTLGCSGRL